MVHQFTTAEISDLELYWGFKKRKKSGSNSLRVLISLTLLYKL